MPPGGKAATLKILGNNLDAKEKLAEIRAEGDRLREESPELTVKINKAQAQAEMAVLKEQFASVRDAALETEASITEAMGGIGHFAAVTDADLEAADQKLKATAADFEWMGRSAAAAGDETAAMGDKATVAGSKTARAAELGAKAWQATKLAVLGLGVTIGVGVEQAGKFQQAMKVVQTQAGASAGMTAQLSDGVLKLAGAVGESPDSLAEATYHVTSNMESMGATSTQILSAVKVAAEGAQVGQADLVDVTNALGAAIASGIPGVQNYQSAMGVLNATVGAGDMTMQNLAEAMGTGFLSNVKLYGSTLNDVGSILATFGDNNIRGAEAGTQLRMAVQALAVQAKSAAPILKQMGLEADSLGKYQSAHGTVATITMLSQKLKEAGYNSTNMGQAITDLFGKKAGAGIGVLIDQVDRLDSKQKVLADGAKGFGNAWQEQQHTVTQQFNDLKQGSDALVISLGAALLPTAINVMHVLSSIVQFLEAHKALGGGILSLIGGVAGIVVLNKAVEGIKGVAGAVESLWETGGKAISLLGKAVTGLPRLFNLVKVASIGLWEVLAANPIILVIAGISLLVVAFVLLWNKSAAFRDFWIDAWKIIRGAAESAFNWLKHNWPLVLGILTGPIGLAAVFVAKHWDEIEHGAQSLLGKLESFFKSLPGRITGALGDVSRLLWNAGISIISGFLNGLISKFDDVKNFVGGIGSWIAAHKGPIEYDATLLRPHGQVIMGSLVNGLQDGMPSLTRQLSRTTNAIANTRVPGIAAAGGSNAALTAEWIGGSGADQEFITWLKKNIRLRGGDPGVLGR